MSMAGGSYPIRAGPSNDCSGSLHVRRGGLRGCEKIEGIRRGRPSSAWPGRNVLNSSAKASIRRSTSSRSSLGGSHSGGACIPCCPSLPGAPRLSSAIAPANRDARLTGARESGTMRRRGDLARPACGHGKQPAKEVGGLRNPPTVRSVGFSLRAGRPLRWTAIRFEPGAGGARPSWCAAGWRGPATARPARRSIRPPATSTTTPRRPRTSSPTAPTASSIPATATRRWRCSRNACGWPRTRRPAGRPPRGCRRCSPPSSRWSGPATGSSAPARCSGPASTS